MKKRILSAMMAIAMTAGLLSACGGSGGYASGGAASSGAEKTVKDSVTVVLNSEPNGIDPQQTNQINAFVIQAQVFDTLVTIGGDGTPQPCLAESWETVDECTVRFHLRDDVTFHNGEKMTAEDVRYSIERATLNANSATMFSAFDGEKTAVVDETTVDIVTKEPFAAIFTYLSMSRAGIVCKSAVEEMGDDEAKRTPIGTGAFQFVDWSAGTQVTLERNENFWGEKPAYTTLTFKFVTEAASRAIEVETGNADIAFNPDASDVDRLSGSGDVTTVITPAFGATSIYLNPSDPVLSDLKVRQAMAYALDLEAIAESVYGAMGSAPGGICAQSFTSAAKLDLCPYDPDKARQLLSEAGYGEGEAEITVLAYTASDVQSIAEICQNMWKAAGFKVNLVQADMSAVLSDVREYKGSCWICGWSYAADDGGFFIGDFDPTYTGNFTYAFESRITDLKNQAASCMDPEERNELYRQAQEILYYEDMAIITVADKNIAYLTTPNVTGFVGAASGAPYLGDIVVYQ
ncbi:ABC transporter substrate-binding protein [Oscillibacter sp. MSJ-2]|uniref:ABC transporter substrate-binding protein n=1 Tax=Dysosmobacter acutus TaxID=2841504 RepID=A0ABS6FCE8_9FIRM|nr:ABC transporter substrate-binding protein [Dysosmobacter acutus]MBU5627968.1 ABC transporter substrate-binding protein [Dysosmobacter acutus]